MGQTTDSRGIASFWPDDTDECFYVVYGAGLYTILEVATNKWPGISAKDLHITSEYIHTDCLYYDLYDPIDYTCFLKIERKNAYQ